MLSFVAYFVRFPPRQDFSSKPNGYDTITQRCYSTIYVVRARENMTGQWRKRLQGYVSRCYEQLRGGVVAMLACLGRLQRRRNFLHDEKINDKKIKV